MNEQKFWKLIEASWSDSPELFAIRSEALETNDDEVLTKLSIALDKIITENYIKRLAELNKEDMTRFIHLLEEKLYNIDRQEIHDYTDGGDDGFLYCRCFIVGMGEKYYNMVNNDPSTATEDLDAESFGFSAYGVYYDKFGEEFERNSIHCIETASNPNGNWD